jgi:hypothetical protein
MKLSEAILKGCEMTPKQAFGDMGTRGKATCAVAAALEGAGFEQGYSPYRAFGLDDVLFDEVVELNDRKRWSRERIASWLAEKGL